MKKWTHFDDKGQAHMVDVSGKADSDRMARAQGDIFVNEEVFQGISQGTMKKGDVLGVARVAGIMGAKKTSDLIPMCHPIPLTKLSLEFELDEDLGRVRAVAVAKTTGPTGVEMEALTAVQIALLTIYDMCKAVDRGMRMSDIQLMEKSGGTSGHYLR